MSFLEPPCMLQFGKLVSSPSLPSSFPSSFAFFTSSPLHKSTRSFSSYLLITRRLVASWAQTPLACSGTNTTWAIAPCNKILEMFHVEKKTCMECHGMPLLHARIRTTQTWDSATRSDDPPRRLARSEKLWRGWRTQILKTNMGLPRIQSKWWFQSSPTPSFQFFLHNASFWVPLLSVPGLQFVPLTNWYK